MKIEVKHLNKKFAKQVIYQEAGLAIEEPGIYGLVAPNGYGKTTLLNILAGLDDYQGEVLINGQAPNQVEPLDFAYLQNSSILYDYLTGYDHLEFIRSLHNLEKEQITAVAQTYQMEEFLHKKTGKYSQGMKQRLLLALAMIKNPKVILMDEPLTGLDPTSTLILRDELLKLKESDVTILISSHDLDELDKLTHKVFFIDQQKLTYEDFSTEQVPTVVVQVSAKDVVATKRAFADFGIEYSLAEQIFEINSRLSSQDILEILVNKGIAIEAIQTKNRSSETIYQEKYLKK